MDSYLLRFERYATAQKWKKEDWATSLSALLKGKALDVYALMPVEEALNYDMLKAALLKRYELTEEGFKRRYKKCRSDSGETFQQFTSRMKSYFTRWIEMSGINKTYDGLADLILRDQFACFICGDKKHIARFCPDRAKGNNMKVAAARTGGRGRSRSPSKHVRFQDQRQGEELSDDRKSDDNQVCGACFIHTDTVSYVQASNMALRSVRGRKMH